MDDGLTGAQQDTLSAIKDHIEDFGWPPTRAELARVLGVNPNAVQDCLRIIERKGYIKVTPGLARGIRVVWEGQA